MVCVFHPEWRMLGWRAGLEKGQHGGVDAIAGDPPINLKDEANMAYLNE